MERVARAREVAAAIVHLLSDDAGFITGATVPVDGARRRWAVGARPRSRVIRMSTERDAPSRRGRPDGSLRPVAVLPPPGSPGRSPVRPSHARRRPG
ncbi:SDR family oxidoreductase [Streptosporangium sp. NPDC002544]|uniref:SDR family oxidoreductase n=1 Tax=Streptosporangium sp. NPDC002544 TaxID=3154538 RepID=UPI003324BC5C